MEATSSLTATDPQILALASSAPWGAACTRRCFDDKPFRSKHGDMRVDDHASDPIEHEISFGPFRLLPGRRLLLECDKPVHIGNRALDLLIALTERHGELVSKPELIAKVWRHTFVDEGNLKVQVAALRRALADGRAGIRTADGSTWTALLSSADRSSCFLAAGESWQDLAETIKEPGDPS